MFRRIVPVPGFAVCSGQYKRPSATLRLQSCRWQWCLTGFKHIEVDKADKMSALETENFERR